MSSLLTLGGWVRDRARITPERVAIDYLERTVTYADLDASSSALAAEFTDRGLARGDRVAVLADNCPEYVAVFFACAKAGLVMTPLNWRLTVPELAYQLDHSEAGLLVFSAGRAEQASAAVAAVAKPPAVRDLESPADPGGDVDGTVLDDDPLLLVYTSGTTGHPKGAVLTHANCFWTNLSIDHLMDVTTFDVVLQVLPQFHVGGWNVQPLLAWWKGATVVLEPTFDPGRALALIESKRVTTMMGVPATYLFMADHPDFVTTDLSSLRMAVVGGAPLPEGIIRTWTDRGVALVQGYGLSEASPNVLGLAPEYAAQKVGYAGKAYPHVEVALGDEDGELLSGPATGELLVRGPNVFAGYWRDPDATAEALRGGWLHTGDVAERDAEGFYRIRDRVKDMYITGGENVYPAEVESVLADHPAVVEVAVVGIPDDRWGEVGVAVVVTREEITAADLIDWCAPRLARFKVPRQVRFVDELPRSGMNKVLKRQLVDDLVSEKKTMSPAEPSNVWLEATPPPAKSVDGTPLSSRGERTRRALLEAAEEIFAEYGWEAASIVKITERAGASQGTFYRYFVSKQAIFDELVDDLNRRVRRAMAEGAARGRTRTEAERHGFEGFFQFTSDHPALYRVIRQAEFASPPALHRHYERIAAGYRVALAEAMEAGEIAQGDPEVLAYALMGVGELIGMRWILWNEEGKMPPEVLDEVMAFIRRGLGATS